MAATGVHRHGPHLFLLVIILVLVAVGLILFVQRRRDRRPLEESTPAARVQQEASGAVIGDRSVAASPARALKSVTRRGGATTEMAKQLPTGRYGIGGLLRSEWTKLRTVRSTMWTLGVTIVLGIGVSAIATAETRAHWSTMSPGSRASFDPTSTSLIGIFIGQFAIGILGALVISAEYSTGTIRATFSAAPRRPLVLVAKVVVFGIVALVVAGVAAFLAFFLGQALLGAPATHATLASPGALREVVGSGLYVGVIGLFALGLGTIIRHTAGAISAFIGVLLVLPLINQALPTSITLDVRRFLPGSIGATMISLHVGPHLFSPWTGLLVLCGYTLGALIIGGALLVRRDA
ncbi:MAG: ABC transporter permease subunit [Acidimicrobiales bacterium]